MTLATPVLEALWPSQIATAPTIASYQAVWWSPTVLARWILDIRRDVISLSDPGSGGDVIHRARVQLREP